MSLSKLLAAVTLVLCLTLAFMIPAFAEGTSAKSGKMNTNMNDTYRTNVNGTTAGPGYGGFNGTGAYTDGNTVNPNGYGVRNNGVFDTNRTTTDTYRTNGTNNYRPYSVDNNVRANTYRARAAADNDRDFNWGWLGLLGLIGLAGMRSRNRENAR